MPTNPRTYTGNWQAIVELAATFPCLKDTTLTGNREEDFQRITEGYQLGGSGKRQTLDFLLHVWNGSEWNMGRSWAIWDKDNKAAWIEWARDPWFC
jgi:hypothetical protein